MNIPSTGTVSIEMMLSLSPHVLLSLGDRGNCSIGDKKHQRFGKTFGGAALSNPEHPRKYPPTAQGNFDPRDHCFVHFHDFPWAAERLSRLLLMAGNKSSKLLKPTADRGFVKHAFHGSRYLRGFLMLPRNLTDSAKLPRVLLLMDRNGWIL